jgi:signal transduction histidine kinase
LQLEPTERNGVLVLHDFIIANRERIISRARLRVRGRMPFASVEARSEHGVPLFLTQLVQALQRASAAKTLRLVGLDEADQDINDSASLHGRELLRSGFTVAQVVHGYGDVCQIVTELAFETHAAISPDNFNTFNRCLDDAIAGAVTAYGRQRESDLASSGLERRGVWALELRHLSQTATLSFDSIRRGMVALTGNTSAVLGRSLARLTALVEYSLAEVRLEAGTPKLDRILVCEFMEEIQIVAVMRAEALGLSLSIAPIDGDLAVDADRQLLSSATLSLLEKAFKFTRINGNVSILVHAIADRVLIDVWDECGGLDSAAAQELFGPFAREGSDRSGLGLGLSIALSAVRANSGNISARSIPGTGCVFTIDLPRRRGPQTASAPPFRLIGAAAPAGSDFGAVDGGRSGQTRARAG